MKGIFGIIVIIIYFLIISWWKKRQRIARKEYYREYLKSDEWKRKRYVVLKRDNWICQYCGGKAEQVHHKKYARNIGKEPIKWLESICKSCHSKLHSKTSNSFSKPKFFGNRMFRVNKTTKYDASKLEFSKSNHSKRNITNTTTKTVDTTKNYVQENWKAEQKFLLCPKNISSQPIIDYLNKIRIGEIFNKAVKYDNSESIVEDFSVSIDKKRIWIITKIQGFRFGLIEVRFEDNVFKHISHRTYMTITGARKEMTLKQGNEWTGKDSIDDYT